MFKETFIKLVVAQFVFEHTILKTFHIQAQHSNTWKKILQHHLALDFAWTENTLPMIKCVGIQSKNRNQVTIL